LTGETGAGKSIILMRLMLLWGKVDRRVIRTGANRAMEATFKLDQALAAWLAEQEIELLDDSSVVCSRELTGSSLRSRSR